MLQKQIPMWLKFSMLGFLNARNEDFVLICLLFCPVHHGLSDHKGRGKKPLLSNMQLFKKLFAACVVMAGKLEE